MVRDPDAISGPTLQELRSREECWFAIMVLARHESSVELGPRCSSVNGQYRITMHCRIHI